MNKPLSKRNLKSHFLVFFCMICILFSCSARYPSDKPGTLTKISIIDQDGFKETITSKERLSNYNKVDFLKPQSYRKVLRGYATDTHGESKAYITSYHPNGQIKQYLEVLNGRAHGSYKEWYANGTLKLKAHPIGGSSDLDPLSQDSWIFDGTSSVWNEKGSLHATINYSKGALEGNSLYFHPNTQLHKKVPYQKNKVNGVIEIYSDLGDLLQETNYVDDEKNGPSVAYHNPTTKAYTEQYVNGLLLFGQYFDREGNLLEQVVDGNGRRLCYMSNDLLEIQEYKQGRKEGLFEVLSKSNNLIHSYNIRNNLKHGEEILYYENYFFDTNKASNNTPIAKLSINWHEGYIHGPVKTWYPNGLLAKR